MLTPGIQGTNGTYKQKSSKSFLYFEVSSKVLLQNLALHQMLVGRKHSAATKKGKIP